VQRDDVIDMMLSVGVTSRQLCRFFKAQSVHRRGSIT